MKQIKINFVKLLKGYKPGWVGISSDFKKVLVWGKTLEEATQKVKKIKERIYYFPAGESYSNFVGILYYGNNNRL
ncbi:MAG: hypothetical protein AAB600_04125 [Patescibacteria group bacterium]